MITRHIWEASKEQARENRLTLWGNKDLQTTKGGDRAQFRGYETTSQTPLYPFSWVAESANTVFFGSNSPKYQEDNIADRNALLLLFLENKHFIAGEVKITP